jgi:putative ABC transport system permease protein
VPGVAEVSPVAALTASVQGNDAPIVGIDPGTFSHMIGLTTTVGSLSDLDRGGIAVDTSTAEAMHLKAGDEVRVDVGGVVQEYRLDVVYEPAGEFAGFLLDRATLDTGTTPVPDRLVYVKADSGADLAQLHRALEAAMADDPTVQVQSQAQFAQEITSSVDQILLVMVMLLSLAVLIAVLGIVNTLVLSVTERTREIGMLRAVGALRRQIRTMVVLEALVIALFGAVVGVVLGIAVATSLQRTLMDQGITELAIPWLWLVVLVAVAGLVGVLAAVWPAFRAGRLSILRAISTE